MSLFQEQQITCPSCGQPVAVLVNFSVNAGRRPDLREAVLDGTFQQERCGACGATFRVEPELAWLDVDRGAWFLVKPAREEDQWADLERMADTIFDGTYGPGAPGAARSLGESLQVRVVFGWTALREKLVIQDAGLDDTEVELLKLALLRGDEAPPLSDEVELRLVEADDERLRFVWLGAGDEVAHEEIEAPRAALEAVTGPEWAELRAALSAGPFRDVSRLLVDSE
jgi:hypothetical protein